MGWMPDSSSQSYTKSVHTARSRPAMCDTPCHVGERLARSRHPSHPRAHFRLKMAPRAVWGRGSPYRAAAAGQTLCQRVFRRRVQETTLPICHPLVRGELACPPPSPPHLPQIVAVGHAPPLYKSWTPFSPLLHLSLSSPLIHWLCIQPVTRFNTSLLLSQHERIPWLLLVVTFRPLRASSAPKSLSLALPVSYSFPSVSTSSRVSRPRTVATKRNQASSSRFCCSATLAS